MERERQKRSRSSALSASPACFPLPMSKPGSASVCSMAAADVAVGCPFGGEERGGRVLIFNGNRDVRSRGLALSQELRATGTPRGSMPGFGFTLRGGQDLDANQYPGKHVLSTTPLTVPNTPPPPSPTPTPLCVLFPSCNQNPNSTSARFLRILQLPCAAAFHSLASLC